MTKKHTVTSAHTDSQQHRLNCFYSEAAFNYDFFHFRFFQQKLIKLP